MMNRRELFQQVAAVSVAAGAVKPSAIEMVDAGSKPAIMVLECAERVPVDKAEHLQRNLSKSLEGTPFEGVKVLVLDSDLKLTMLGSDGTVLNERIADPVENHITVNVKAVDSDRFPGERIADEVVQAISKRKVRL